MAGDAAAFPSSFFLKKLIRFGQFWLNLGKIGKIWANLSEIWAKVIKIWENLIRLGQDQNLASPKTFDLLRLCIQ